MTVTVSQAVSVINKGPSAAWECHNLSAEHKLQLFLDFYKCSLEATGNVSSWSHASWCCEKETAWKILRTCRKPLINYSILHSSICNHVQVCRKTFSGVFALSHKLSQFYKRKIKKEKVFMLVIGENMVRQENIQKNTRKKICEHIRFFP